MTQTEEEYTGYGFASGGIAFIGCLLLGVGLGVWQDQLIAGAFIGAGVGFVVMAIMAHASMSQNSRLNGKK